jgi:hypothetical protein
MKTLDDNLNILQNNGILSFVFGNKISHQAISEYYRCSSTLSVQKLFTQIEQFHQKIVTCVYGLVLISD